MDPNGLRSDGRFPRQRHTSRKPNVGGPFAFHSCRAGAILDFRCWRRMDRKDIPADNLSSLEAGRLLFANTGMTRDKTSDKIANH